MFRFSNSAFQQILLASTAACALVLIATTPAKASIEEGIAAYNAKNFTEAVRLLTEAKKTNFSNATLHYYLGNSLIHLNSKDAAIKEYKLAMDLEPDGKLAEYCQSALATLVPAPAPTPTLAAKTKTPSVVAAAPVKKPGSQQPQVFVLLCGCPMCQRVEAMVTTWHSKFGNEINFIRTVRNATDGQTQAIVQNYHITACPTILLFDNQGRMIKQYSEMMSEELVNKDVVALAATSSEFSRISTTEDPHLIRTRDAIVGEVEARIANDRKRVDNEIKMANDSAAEESTRNPRDQQRLVFGAQAKIRELEKDFERRKREWYEDADKRLQALGINGSTKELKAPHPASD